MTISPRHIVTLASHREITDSKTLNQTLYGHRADLHGEIKEGIGLVPYRDPNSFELVEATAEPLRKHRMIIWPHHGVLIREESLWNCSHLLDFAELSAEHEIDNQQWASGRLRKRPEFLPEQYRLDDKPLAANGLVAETAVMGVAESSQAGPSEVHRAWEVNPPMDTDKKTSESSVNTKEERWSAAAVAGMIALPLIVAFVLRVLARVGILSSDWSPDVLIATRELFL